MVAALNNSSSKNGHLNKVSYSHRNTSRFDIEQFTLKLINWLDAFTTILSLETSTDINYDFTNYGFPKREAILFLFGHFCTSLLTAIAAKLLFQFKSDLEFKCVSHLGLHLGHTNFPRQPPSFYKKCFLSRKNSFFYGLPKRKVILFLLGHF